VQNFIKLIAAVHELWTVN